MTKYLTGKKMSFAGAISTGFKNFFNFRGVATRRAYWFFVLFTVLISSVIGTVEQIFIPTSTVAMDALLTTLEQDPANVTMALWNASFAESLNSTPISNFVGLIYGIPLLTFLVRRMRDAGFGAWWLLLGWVPLFTFIITLLPTKQKPAVAIQSPMTA